MKLSGRAFGPVVLVPVDAPCGIDVVVTYPGLPRALGAPGVKG